MYVDGKRIGTRSIKYNSVITGLRRSVKLNNLDESDSDRIKHVASRYFRAIIDDNDIKKILIPEEMIKDLKTVENEDLIVKTVANSIEKLEKDINDTYDEVKEIKSEMKEKFAEHPELFHQYSEMLDKTIKMQEMLLKKLGAIGGGITNVINKNITIDNRQLHVALSKQIEFIFKNNEAKVEDGKLIFEKPSFELLETFNKYRKKENAETAETVSA